MVMLPVYAYHIITVCGSSSTSDCNMMQKYGCDGFRIRQNQTLFLKSEI